MGTVRDGKRLEKLTLAEPARALWKRVRQRLTQLRHSEEAADPHAWMMGGGSVLAARWRHRTSTDIDLLTSARWQLRGLDVTGSNALTRAMAALGRQRSPSGSGFTSSAADPRRPPANARQSSTVRSSRSCRPRRFWPASC